jgi:methyl-coenzyme M reductase alpha subunit
MTSKSASGKQKVAELEKERDQLEKEMVSVISHIFNITDLTKERGSIYEFEKLGWRQGKEKRQYVESAARIAKERGIPHLNPEIARVKTGTRKLVPYYVEGEYIEGEGFHPLNNPATQQAFDDMKRTVIIGLDQAHEILEKRLCKEVTPESMNFYLESVQHTMAGGSVAQEHLGYINPECTKDCYVKVFTGDDELADQIDDCYLIDINKLFPESQAAQLKGAIGKKLYEVVRLPTMAVRAGAGGLARRWAALQKAMAFINAYNLTGQAAMSDFVYGAKHADVVVMGTPSSYSRAFSDNEPYGVPGGYWADMVQTLRVQPDKPEEYIINSSCVGLVLGTQITYGFYMIGGIGLMQAIGMYMSDKVIDDSVRYFMESIQKKYGGPCTVQPDEFSKIAEITKDVNIYMQERWEKYPALMEAQWSSYTRNAMAQEMAGDACAWATGNADMGRVGGYLCVYHQRAYQGRSGWYSYDSVPFFDLASKWTMRPEYGIVEELLTNNYSAVSPQVFVGVQLATCYSASAHAGRGDAYCANPLIKVAFADPSLKFDWAHPRKCIVDGAMGRFMPEGERTAICPPQ